MFWVSHLRRQFGSNGSFFVKLKMLSWLTWTNETQAKHRGPWDYPTLSYSAKNRIKFEQIEQKLWQKEKRCPIIGKSPYSDYELLCPLAIRDVDILISNCQRSCTDHKWHFVQNYLANRWHVSTNLNTIWESTYIASGHTHLHVELVFTLY